MESAALLRWALELCGIQRKLDMPRTSQPSFSCSGVLQKVLRFCDIKYDLPAAPDGLVFGRQRCWCAQSHPPLSSPAHRELQLCASAHHIKVLGVVIKSSKSSVKLVASVRVGSATSLCRTERSIPQAHQAAKSNLSTALNVSYLDQPPLDHEAVPDSWPAAGPLACKGQRTGKLRMCVSRILPNHC